MNLSIVSSIGVNYGVFLDLLVLGLGLLLPLSGEFASPYFDFLLLNSI